MDAKSQQPKERDGTISTLNAAIETLNLAKELVDIAPAKAVFGSVSVILATIRVSSLHGFLLTECRPKCTQDAMINRMDYVELGLACSDVCTALGRGLEGKRLSDLNNSVCEAINQLTT
jgi:hypothetical protein